MTDHYLLPMGRGEGGKGGRGEGGKGGRGEGGKGGREEGGKGGRSGMESKDFVCVTILP